MVEEKILYQTIEDTGEYNFILHEGPFKCNTVSAWLGEGYYFWDTLISNAHWWGEVRYSSQKKKYLITKGKCDFEVYKCLDLHNNLSQLSDFEKTYKRLRSAIGDSKSTITVSQVIEYLKQTKCFSFQAIRACGVLVKNEKNRNSGFSIKIPFENSCDKRLLETCPPVQICLINKNSMGFRDYDIITNDINPIAI